MCPLIEKKEYESAEIIESINRGEDIYLSKKIIIDDFSLAPSVGEGEISNFPQKILTNIAFIGCEFKGQVKIQNVIFEKRISFQGCRFEKDVKFWPFSPEFLDEIDLSFAYFQESADFHGVKFQKELKLFNSIFYKGVEFNQAEFGSIDAKYVTFSDRDNNDNLKIYFHDCRFMGPADFSGSIFKCKADFGGSQFNETVELGCTFEKDAIFSNVLFRKEVTLTVCTFKRDFILYSARIGVMLFGYEFQWKEMQEALSHIGIHQIRQPENLIKKLRDENKPLYNFLKSKFSDSLKGLINGFREGEPSTDLMRQLITELNSILKGPSFYDRELFNDIALSDETRNQLKRRDQGLYESIPLNRLLIDDAFPEEIVRENFGVNFSERSHIILSGAFFDQMIIHWSKLKDHLIEKELLNGFIIPQLREGYKKIGWFEESDQCFKYYIDARIKNLKENKRYFQSIQLIIISKFLYGYGVYPSYPIKSGIFIIILFSFFFFISKYRQFCNLCLNQLGSSIEDALITSIISFVATPYQPGFFATSERFLGWIIVSCFLIALASKTLR